MSTQQKGPEKTGSCWCGCDEATDSYFLPGHDAIARNALLEIVYGKRETVEILEMLGFSPSNSVSAARDRVQNKK